MKKSRLLCVSSLIGVFVYLFVLPRSVWAQDVATCWSDDPAFGRGGVAIGSGNPAQIQGLECVLMAVFNIIVRLAGLAAFAMLFWGGFQYLTSGGDKEKTKKAAATLTWAAGGLATLLLLWLVLKFVEIFTNVDVAKFIIPS